MFKGSIVALITPMNSKGDIDFAALKQLVEFHIRSGTHGIVAVGTTGESATLPVDEHIAVVKAIVEYTAGRIPVIAGSGANSTQEAIELSQAMAPLGVDGFLSVVPYYNKPQQKGMIAHFTAIADSTDLPVLLYNVPSRTVADMLPETVIELARHPKIIGIKEATGDLSRINAIKQGVGDDFILLSGDDETGCEFICRGGDGVISVSNNVAPALMAKMVNTALAGEADVARQIDAHLAPLHNALFLEPNPVMPKYALHRMGMIASDFLRLPMVTAEQNNKKSIEKVMLDMGLIE